MAGSARFGWQGRLAGFRKILSLATNAATAAAAYDALNKAR
jgi:hypothetical protein